MSDTNIKYKDIIKSEWLKCSQDPVYFFKKYYYIQHPTKGRMLFNLYPFQEKILRQFQREEYFIINKSRQLGISTLSSAFGLWLMLFHKDKSILCIATTQDTAKNLVTKVRFSYENLPSWLKLKTTENNKLLLKLSNGSQIQAKAATDNAARSESVSLLIIDEAAFIDNIELIYVAAQQTLATGGFCIALSSPNGTGNWFHTTFEKAQNKENRFIPLLLPWTVHPERDQAWRDKQDIELGPKHAAQECDADFTTSGDTVIDLDLIKWYETECMKPPMETRGENGAYWIWQHVDYSKQYMVIADVARGDGADYSSFHVFDVDNLEQVAEFKYQLPTKDFAHVLYAVGVEWNDALLIIENANVGWDVIGRIIDKGYRNLYYSPKLDMNSSNTETYLSKFEDGSDMVAGFSMTLKTRPLVVSKLISYINDRSVIIRSKRTFSELRNFIWKHGRAEAAKNCNDDLVMPLGIGLFLRDTALRFKQQGVDMARATLGSIYSVNSQTQKIYTSPNSYAENPYKMDNGHGGMEDLNWLLQ